MLSTIAYKPKVVFYPLLCAILAACMFPFTLSAQLQIDKPIEKAISIYENATLVNTGQKKININYLLENETDFSFSPLKNANENIGFTDDYYWVKFAISNNTDKNHNYYLETARPIIDFVNLHTVNKDGEIQTQYNGDAISFDQKSVQHRKSIFNINLKPKENLSYYLHIKSDGESLLLPLKLQPNNTFITEVYGEQIFYGLFYGVLLLAFIIYLFFYFGLKNRLFLWYSLYILFVGLLQFSVDGLFHQYVTPSGGWLNDKGVLLIACTSVIFFLKYAEHFLEVNAINKFFKTLFKVYLYVLFVTLFSLVSFPSFLKYGYPIANLLGLIVIISIITAIVVKIGKGHKVDPYFTAGIGFLVFGFVVFILNNFSLLPNSFFAENGPKFGTGLEVIFLSISMSNRIRSLRLENDENQKIALQRSKDMNDIKSYFLSNLSHELRTPLNLIMAVAKSLDKTCDTTEIMDKSDLITTSSQSLLTSIEAILDYTNTEKGDYSIENKTFSLHNLISKIKKISVPKAAEKKLELSFPDLKKIPENIKGDEKKLSQILINVIDNAIKFTEKGKVTLTVKPLGGKKGKIGLLFQVKDTGIGIEANKISTIFESFTKKSFDDKREFEGLGLGLYIAKTCVDIQKGNIHIENNRTGGVTCNVKLTFEMPDNKIEVLPKPNVQRDLQNCNILLVEDNKMNQTVVKMMVKKWKNTSLTIANNGQEGLDILQKKSFDVVLMDLQMPIMDGFEAIAHIKHNTIEGIYENIPIIVLTADSTTTSKNKTQQLGVQGYLTKPVDENLLYHNIKVVLSKSLKKAS